MRTIMWGRTLILYLMVKKLNFFGKAKKNSKHLGPALALMVITNHLVKLSVPNISKLYPHLHIQKYNEPMSHLASSLTYPVHHWSVRCKCALTQNQQRIFGYLYFRDTIWIFLSPVIDRHTCMSSYDVLGQHCPN